MWKWPKAKGTLFQLLAAWAVGQMAQAHQFGKYLNNLDSELLEGWLWQLVHKFMLLFCFGITVTAFRANSDHIWIGGRSWGGHWSCQVSHLMCFQMSNHCRNDDFSKIWLNLMTVKKAGNVVFDKLSVNTLIYSMKNRSNRDYKLLITVERDSFSIFVSVSCYFPVSYDRITWVLSQIHKEMEHHLHQTGQIYLFWTPLIIGNVVPHLDLDIWSDWHALLCI